MRDCKEKAVEWGVSERSVNDMCKKGKIPGAVKHSGKWCIPDDAIKPVDGRVSSGKYKKKKVNEKRKSLPRDNGAWRWQSAIGKDSASCLRR